MRWRRVTLYAIATVTKNKDGAADVGAFGCQGDGALGDDVGGGRNGVITGGSDGGSEGGVK